MHFQFPCADGLPIKVRCTTEDDAHVSNMATAQVSPLDSTDTSSVLFSALGNRLHFIQFLLSADIHHGVDQYLFHHDEELSWVWIQMLITCMWQYLNSGSRQTDGIVCPATCLREVFQDGLWLWLDSWLKACFPQGLHAHLSTDRTQRALSLSASTWESLPPRQHLRVWATVGGFSCQTRNPISIQKASVCYVVFVFWLHDELAQRGQIVPLREDFT